MSLLCESVCGFIVRRLAWCWINTYAEFCVTFGNWNFSETCWMTCGDSIFAFLLLLFLSCWLNCLTKTTGFLSFVALTHLDYVKLWGKQMELSLSKYKSVQMPKEGTPVGDLFIYLIFSTFAAVVMVIYPFQYELLLFSWRYHWIILYFKSWYFVAQINRMTRSID